MPPLPSQPSNCKKSFGSFLQKRTKTLLFLKKKNQKDFYSYAVSPKSLAGTPVLASPCTGP
jgi:hypothetical protein